MPLADRCDEIVRLIDDVLREVTLCRTSCRAAGALPGPATAQGPDATPDGTRPAHGSDGRWWQRPVPEASAETRPAA